MKYITHIFRILVGALFIFSGFIKSNDTKGFGIKLHEYFEVFAQDAQATQDTFSIHFKSPWYEESYAIPIYEGEDYKTYTIQTFAPEEEFEMIFEETDTATGETKEVERLAKEMYVFCNQASNTILRDTLYESDSAFAGNIEVRASVGGKEIYSKTTPLIMASGQTEEAIDIAKYVKKSSWLVGFFKWISGFAVPMAMFIVLFEILLGLMLLIGFKNKFTVWMLLLMTLFFTFLTFYAAYYNKVTDCGCFGDAIKLKPWETFQKDVVLSIMILFLFFTVNYIKPIFSVKFAKTLLVILMSFCILFTMYCYLYLPVFDFLKYSEGSNLRERIAVPKGELERDILEKTMLYKDANGKDVNVVYNSEFNTFKPAIPVNGQFVKVVSEKILKEAYKPDIHDWGNIFNANNQDISDSIMNSKGYTLLLVSVYLDDVHRNIQPKMNKLFEEWNKTNHAFYAMTSSSPAEIDEYIKTKEVKYNYCIADNKLLTSMIRSNPGLILVKDAVVLKRWSFRGLPSPEELIKLTSK